MTTMLERTAKVAGLVLLGLLMLGAAGWGALALLYWDHANETLRYALLAAYGITSLACLVGFLLPRWRWRSVAGFALIFTALLISWLGLEPSNDRDWQPENAMLAYATVAGDRVTLHNIRNFDYRSETDFTPSYYDRSFDLRQLDAVDLFAVYWMGPAIAHTFLSFGFADGSHVAISIEARKERGEGYSSVQGFFRQYELYYVVGDERDLVRLRTNYRRDPPEQVYLYSLRGTRADGQRLFLEYLREINALKSRPEWYNTLTTNCTSNIWLHSRVNPGHVPYSWKILLSGYLPEYLYERGTIDNRVPFDTLQARAQINSVAKAADQSADFSRRIRAGAGSIDPGKR
jgi:hypothetical protein